MEAYCCQERNSIAKLTSENQEKTDDADFYNVPFLCFTSSIISFSTVFLIHVIILFPYLNTFQKIFSLSLSLPATAFSYRGTYPVCRPELGPGCLLQADKGVSAFLGDDMGEDPNRPMQEKKSEKQNKKPRRQQEKIKTQNNFRSLGRNLPV